MATLVVGATGATGRLLVKQLLDRGERVRVIVRAKQRLPEELLRCEGLEVVLASLLDLSDAQLDEAVAGCRAVASCLGHNLSFRGIYGQPRRLVAEATRRLCEAVRRRAPRKPVRFVLLNATGNRNRDLDEPIRFTQRLVMGLIRVALPPHPDNEAAAEYLRTEVGQAHETIEWVVVRPDSLIDEDEVSEYELHRSPTRSPLFNPGKTSRINLGAFMATLITNDNAWSDWRGQMPVIYNAATPSLGHVA